MRLQKWAGIRPSRTLLHAWSLLSKQWKPQRVFKEHTYIFSTQKIRCNQEEEEEEKKNAGTTYVGKGNQVMTATNIVCLYYSLISPPYLSSYHLCYYCLHCLTPSQEPSKDDQRGGLRTGNLMLPLSFSPQGKAEGNSSPKDPHSS